METIMLRQRADAKGELTITVPTKLRDAELDMLVVLQPVPLDDPKASSTSASDPEYGWPVGFFEETYGSLAADPIERLPQGELERRETLQ